MEAADHRRQEIDSGSNAGKSRRRGSLAVAAPCESDTHTGSTAGLLRGMNAPAARGLLKRVSHGVAVSSASGPGVLKATAATGFARWVVKGAVACSALSAVCGARRADRQEKGPTTLSPPEEQCELIWAGCASLGL